MKLLCLLCAVLLLGGCAAPPAETAEPEPGGAQDPLSFELLGERTAENDDFKRYVWVSYLDLRDILCADGAVFASRVDTMCDNTGVFLQVRAFGDAIYPSSLFPHAGTTVYEDFSADVDYLSVFCEKLHARGMEVHAWVNPYRLSASEDEEYVRFVGALREKDVLCVVEHDGALSLNPGNETARALVVDGVRELLDAHDVDGVHFDDYFYPTTEESYDENTYAAFLEGGGMMSLDDFRRAAVSTLIADVYAAVKEKDATLVFGVSPDANIKRDYAVHYANVALWCQSEGYVDYICPQIYFGFENESLPFSQTLRQWAELCGTCELLCGLSFYKAGKEDIYAGTGSAEWQQNFDVIARQYADCRSLDACKGAALYRYASVYSPPEETASYAGLELYNLQKEIG